MSNIKGMYWVPCLGAAFMWNDPECSLNTREERIMLLYHVMVLCLLIALGIGLLMRLSPY
ncbi:MAG: hypothetical protein P8Z38_05475 [Robiginitalea sp.]